MRILFCAPERITKELGAPKVYIELAEALEEKGCSCKLVGLEDVAPNLRRHDSQQARNEYYSRRLRQYIWDHCGEFDVIEFEHKHLPFPRSSLPEESVLVARSVLLGHHAQNIGLPVWSGLSIVLQNAVTHFLIGDRNTRPHLGDFAAVLKKHLGTAIRYQRTTSDRKQQARHSTKTCTAADLVIASNAQDRRTLEQEGIDPEKIEILPFGLTADRYEALSPTTLRAPSPPTFVTVGTFDFRKGGATDMPHIARYLLPKYPSARFRLLGTGGLFTDEEEVLAHFHPSLHDRIEVVVSYSPENLPDLLRGGTVGIFPSYYEGFPFGVLEMLAAGLPVVAYEAPGAPEMVPEDLLVEPGAWAQLARRAEWLVNNQSLQNRRREATTHAQQLRWSIVADKTIRAYEDARSESQG